MRFMCYNSGSIDSVEAALSEQHLNKSSAAKRLEVVKQPPGLDIALTTTCRVHLQVFVRSHGQDLLSGYSIGTLQSWHVA